LFPQALLAHLGQKFPLSLRFLLVGLGTVAPPLGLKIIKPSPVLFLEAFLLEDQAL